MKTCARSTATCARCRRFATRCRGAGWLAKFAAAALFLSPRTAQCADGAVMTRPLTRRFAAPSPRFAGRGISCEVLLPACGEKVAEGRMRGLIRSGYDPSMGGRILMSKPSGRPITRRRFVKLTGGAAAAAGMTSAFLFPQRALAQQKTLKIVQWSHFVPGYDKWFDGTFTKEWGARHNTNVTVDHIATAEIPARAAAEVAAKRGHDLFMFVSPPASYEKQVIDHKEIYQEVERKHGKKISLAEKSTYNPKTKK